MTERYTILTGDAVDRLRGLPDGAVQCCVTSPPYFGLRSYTDDPAEIGKEKTIAAYVGNLVSVFREVRRVLRDDGLLFLNLGDSYNGSSPTPNIQPSEQREKTRSKALTGGVIPPQGSAPRTDNLPPKSLIGIPWRVAFALQDDGWILRSDIIWAKPAPMPESVTDRCTKSHEYVFMLAKQQRYYYDAEAVKEKSTDPTNHRPEGRNFTGKGYPQQFRCPRQTRNRRDVWAVATEPSSLPHFAMMPQALVRPCVLAGTSEAGQCSECGKPWVRVVEKQAASPGQKPGYLAATGTRNDGERAGSFTDAQTTTIGFKPTCHCNAPAEPQIVIDPFSGMATTGVVALSLGRRFIGVELNPDYAALSEKRLRDVHPPLFDTLEEAFS